MCIFMYSVSTVCRTRVFTSSLQDLEGNRMRQTCELQGGSLESERRRGEIKGGVMMGKGGGRTG